MNCQSSMFHVLCLTVGIVSTASGQSCNGCADTSACHEFSSGNSAFLGCYGTFSGGASGLSALCGAGFIVPNATFAGILGFTSDMCNTVATEEIFFFDQSGVGTVCNSAIISESVWDTKGLWGCSGGSFDGTCTTGSTCADITDYYCDGADFVDANGTTIIDVGTDGDEYNTLSLLDANYGGAVCIQAPTNAPTSVPSNMPTKQPTATPSNVPTGMPTAVPSAPTNAPTDDANSRLSNGYILVSIVAMMLYAALGM